MAIEAALTHITRDHVCAALALTDFDVEAAHRRMAPQLRRMTPSAGLQPRLAAVLILIYSADGHPHLILTRRPTNLRDHSGQISFPGGQCDPRDDSFTATALRETCEELRLCDPKIDILGQLAPLYIPPTNFEAHPVIGWLDTLPTLHPSPAEVAEVIPMPLAWLLDDAYKRRESWPFAGALIDVPYYLIAGHKVWGATAIMLSELEMRLRAVVI